MLHDACQNHQNASSDPKKSKVTKTFVIILCASEHRTPYERPFQCDISIWAVNNSSVVQHARAAALPRARLRVSCAGLGQCPPAPNKNKPFTPKRRSRGTVSRAYSNSVVVVSKIEEARARVAGRYYALVATKRQGGLFLGELVAK